MGIQAVGIQTDMPCPYACMQPAPPPRPPPPPLAPPRAFLQPPYCMPCCVAGVKDAVVDAVEELYLKAATGGAADSCQAAQNLVALAQGSSLGQSSCLEPCPVLMLLLGVRNGPTLT